MALVHAVGKSAVRPGIDSEKDWEEEYKRLREENIGLKQLCNEQEDHIRRYDTVLKLIS